MSVTDDLVAFAIAGSVPSETDRVYPFGAVPKLPVYPYRVIAYAAGAPLVRSMNAVGDPLRRFTVQHFAKGVVGLEDVASTTFATFDGKTFDGNVVTQEVATTPDRDPDDRGVLSTTHTYRF